MYKAVFNLAFILCLSLVSDNLAADAVVGEKAPDFQGKDLKGKNVGSGDFTGKILVLEWSSPECPYSRRYYQNGTLDSLYDFAAQSGIVWINVVPRLQSLPRRQAFKNSENLKKIIIFDETLDITRTYGITTTPQILIIDRQGILAYSGAIDSTAILKTTANGVTPYTRDALNDLLAGREVNRKITRAFGCFIEGLPQNNSDLPTLSGSGSR